MRSTAEPASCRRLPATGDDLPYLRSENRTAAGMPKLKPLFLSGFVGPGGANEPGAVLLNQPGRRERRSPAVPDTLHFYMFTGIEHFAIASPNPKGLADWYV